MNAHNSTVDADIFHRSLFPFSTLIIGVSLIGYFVLIWWWDYPPLIDWPNHMARHYIEGLAISGQAPPAGYELKYALMPNLGGDLVVPLLLQVFNLVTASKIFLSLSLLIYWAGASCFFAAQTGERRSAIAVAALYLPFLISSSFLWGFLNYYSSVGLAFLAMANYIRLYERPRAGIGQLVLQAAFICLLYLWHLAGFGIYAVLHASHLLWHIVQAKRAGANTHHILQRFMPFAGLVIPALLIAVLVKLGGEGEALSGGIEWVGLVRKSRNFFSFFSSYGGILDLAVLALWVCALVAMLTIDRARLFRLTWLHLATILFLVAFLALPFTLGTTSGVDIRMLPPLWVCSLGLLVALPARSLNLGFGFLLLAVTLRLTSIGLAWSDLGAPTQDHLRFISTIEPKSRILSVALGEATRFVPESHVVAWAVPLRQAFVSSLFSMRGQQPLRLSSDFNDVIVRLQKAQTGEIDLAKVGNKFDYFWLFNSGDGRVAIPVSWLLVYKRGAIAVWRIR